MNKRGFTLIELLVAIAIIALILAAAVPNFLGARERAKDAKKKAELNQVKAALRLYYNDYQKYPSACNAGTGRFNFINGCGINGTSCCPCNASVDFAAGGGGCDVVYIKKIPIYTIGTLNYFQVNNGDDFRLYADLENISDPDVTASQSRCPAAGGANYNATKSYAVCAD